MGIRVKVKELRIEQSMKYEVITYFIIVTRESRSNITKYDIDNSKITSLCFTNYMHQYQYQYPFIESRNQSRVEV